MPKRKIHCEFTLRKYGVTGEDIHYWIDEPSRDLGVVHRILRHNYYDWIPQRFVYKYGLDLALDIMRSHIWLDENWRWYQHYF